MRAAARIAMFGALLSILLGATRPNTLVAQTIQGTRPPQPRARSIGELTTEDVSVRFGTHQGRKLGERFGLGHGGPEPGRWVMDVLPMKHGGSAQGTGTYQLTVHESGEWRLVNEDRTLAARGVLEATSCTPKLSLEDGNGVFATIQAVRVSVTEAAPLMNPEFTGYGTFSSPAQFLVTRRGRTHQSDRVDFLHVNGTLNPQRFRLRAADGEQVDVRFPRNGSIEVHHRKAKAFDERTVVNLALMARLLPDLIGLNPISAAEKARPKC